MELRELVRRGRTTRWDRFVDWLDDWSLLVGGVAAVAAVVGLVLTYA